MARLCILTQYFPPEMGAPQARLSELGAQLAARGWSVDVLTALPNYPTGKVFDGYSPYAPVSETYGPMRVARVPLWPSKSGFLKRLGCYGSFAAAAAALGPTLLPPPDLLFVESPPLFIGPAAWALGVRWRCPYVFNVSDLWPESAVRMGVVQPGLAVSAAERLEVALYRRAAGVTGQSLEIIDAVKLKAPATPTCVITNGVDPKRFGKDVADSEARALLEGLRGPVFLYAGLLGLAQGLDQILDVARDLPSEVAASFVLVGDGPERERLLARVTSEKLTRVRILPAQKRERVPPLLACADVAVISLGMSIPGAVPSKIYEAMASSLPVLLIADGEPARRISDAQCGLSASPGDLATVRAHVERLSADSGLRTRLGAAGRRAAETTYDRAAIAYRLDEFLKARVARA